MLSHRYQRQLNTRLGPLRLKSMAQIIGGILAIRIDLSPLRTHRDLLTMDINADNDHLVREQLQWDTDLDTQRLSISGRVHPELKVGVPQIDIARDPIISIDEHGHPFEEIVGVTPRPTAAESDAINTHWRAEDFKKGERVWAWWWHLWWPATVVRVHAATNVLTIRWRYNHECSTGFRPSWVHKVDRSQFWW